MSDSQTWLDMEENRLKNYSLKELNKIRKEMLKKLDEISDFSKPENCHISVREDRYGYRATLKAVKNWIKKKKGLKKLYNPTKGFMKVASFMSGSGTNLEKIIEHQKQNQAYEVVVIFSDTFNSKAIKIGKKYGIPVVIRDLEVYCSNRGKKKTDLKIRSDFDKETIKAISSFEADVIAYAGYMSIVTKPLIKEFLGINVHPADLSIEEDGKRKYTGAHAVKDAIAAGEKYISATTHIVEEEVDYGKLLMISKPLKVVKGGEKVNQERLKKSGDWVIFPKTLEYIALGKFKKDSKGNIYLNGNPIPKGLRIKK